MKLGFRFGLLGSFFVIWYLLVSIRLYLFFFSFVCICSSYIWTILGKMNLNRSFRSQESQLLKRRQQQEMQEKEEELALFFEMRRHEKERENGGLLMNNSEEFDPPLGILFSN